MPAKEFLSLEFCYSRNVYGRRMFDHTERELDVFVKYHISFNDLSADSVQICVGKSVAVASLEHLLRAKRITGRPHDLMDVDGLLAISET